MFSLLHNLYRYIRSKSERRACLIVLGVDNAGKTTLLNTVQGHLDKEVSPTFGFNSTDTTTKTLGLGGRQFTLQVFDLGGGKNIRRVWKSYLAEVHAVVFVTDAADLSRFEECRTVLHETLNQAHLHNKPILVFANKQDLPSAASAAEMAEQLGLSTLKQNPYHIMACTAKTAAGEKPDPRIWQGLTWVMQTVGEAYAVLNPRVEAEVAVVRAEEARKKAEREEKVRQIKEERARQAAEAEAAEAAAAAAMAMSVQQNALLSPLPNGIESPRPGVPPMQPEAAAAAALGGEAGAGVIDGAALQMADFSDLALGQRAASQSLHATIPAVHSTVRTSHHKMPGPKPPLSQAPSQQQGVGHEGDTGALNSSTSLVYGNDITQQLRASGRLDAGEGLLRSSGGSAQLLSQQHDSDHVLKNSFTRQNKVLPVLGV